MEIPTTNYETRQELRISIMQIFPNLVRLKKYSNKTAFYDLLSEAVPELRKYIIKRIKTAIQKNHFSKNKYAPNDFIDQLFIETYDHIEHISNEDEFYVWLYKKTNALLEDAIIEEEFDDLFFQNIEDYSKQEWDQMEEKFTTTDDGDLIMNEDLINTSYHHNIYNTNDVFIEHTESELIKKIDEHLHQEQIDKHIQIVLHNLPLQTRNIFELFTKHHFTIAEIADIRHINIEETKQILDGARKSLRASLFNRYSINEL